MENSILKMMLLSVLIFGCNTNYNDKNGHPVIVNLPEKNAAATLKNDSHNAAFTYDLKAPTHTWKLPQALVEVSGNTWVDKDHLILIEDLHPNLYLIKIDDKNAVLEKMIPFQKDEKDKFDIEDVAIANGNVYALWSHGKLFKISNWNTDPQVKEISTFLSKENNAEGLCYDPENDQLLIACKGNSGIPDEKKSTKAVYPFSLKQETLEEKPFLLINKKGFEKLAEEKVDFNPSAIGVHPVTHDIYLLSTLDNKCMAVFSRDGVLKSFQVINKDLMPQPEGLCFSAEGKLYISSEGKKGDPGNLFEFDPK